MEKIEIEKVDPKIQEWTERKKKEVFDFYMKNRPLSDAQWENVTDWIAATTKLAAENPYVRHALMCELEKIENMEKAEKEEIFTFS